MKTFRPSPRRDRVIDATELLLLLLFAVSLVEIGLCAKAANALLRPSRAPSVIGRAFGTNGPLLEARPAAAPSRKSIGFPTGAARG